MQSLAIPLCLLCQGHTLRPLSGPRASGFDGAAKPLFRETDCCVEGVAVPVAAVPGLVDRDQPRLETCEQLSRSLSVGLHQADIVLAARRRDLPGCDCRL